MHRAGSVYQGAPGAHLADQELADLFLSWDVGCFPHTPHTVYKKLPSSSETLKFLNFFGPDATLRIS